MEVIWSRTSLKHLAEIAQYVADKFRSEYCCQIFGAASEKANALLNFPEQGTLDRKYSTPEYTVHHVNVDPKII